MELRIIDAADLLSMHGPDSPRLEAADLVETAARILRKHLDGRRDDSVLWRLKDAVFLLEKLQSESAR